MQEYVGGDLDEVLWARRIITSLGEIFVSQRFMDRAMECYQLLVEHHPPELDDADRGLEACPEPDAARSPFADLGPDTVTVSTRVNQDVYEILESLKRVEGNEGKEVEELIREGIYLLFLKYAEDRRTRDLIFDKIRTVVD